MALTELAVSSITLAALWLLGMPDMHYMGSVN
jgi:hypothetical protein